MFRGRRGQTRAHGSGQAGGRGVEAGQVCPGLRAWGPMAELLPDPAACASPTTRLAASICQLRHDRMEQGPTEPHAGRSTFLLSSGGSGGRVLLSGL